MTTAGFEHVVIREDGSPLVDLSEYDFVLDPSYFRQGFSSTPVIHLRGSVADMLAGVQRALAPYRMKIWDGYRPRPVQRNIYDHYVRTLRAEHPDRGEEELHKSAEVFVTCADDPRRIPPHATGGAVDLTLVDRNGAELDMGTPFDHFGPESAPLYFEDNRVNTVARGNRRMLRDAMIAAGFRCDADEWWHFDYGNQIWAARYGKSVAVYGEVVSVPGTTGPPAPP